MRKRNGTYVKSIKGFSQKHWKNDSICIIL